MSRFIHLHTHSHYSLLQALPTTKELVHEAKSCEMSALALTDNGNLYGAIEFYKDAKKEGVKPIIGVDFYLAPRTLSDKEAGIDKPRARLVLLAKNYDGYVNLIKLVSASYIDGFYYKPRIDRALLDQYGDNLVAILPSFSSETSQLLRQGAEESAKEAMLWYKKRFGENLFLEITHHPEIAGHQSLMQEVGAFSKKHSIPLVAGGDVFYLKPEDHRARETLFKIQQNATLDDASQDFDEDFSFFGGERAEEYFRDTPEAIENTARIAEMCTVEIPLEEWKFPNYIIESGREPDEELRALAEKGIPWRGLKSDDTEVRERLAYELSVIQTKGYAKYFLVVGDLLREARERNILTTIRGSVAGSLTTYLLGITNVNPLEYKLPFERFLNPERPSAPDIDMDFADNRRDEIIEYTKTKYGAENVAQIGTFGTMMARAAVRDVARALGHPYNVGDRIAKLIPMGSQGFPMTIDRALEMEPDLSTLYKKDAISKDVIDLAKQIEGKVRHISVHAAGVVISPSSVTDFAPVQPDPKGTGKLITQYDMHAVGEDGVGLLKFDFLGIRNLSILADAVLRVKKTREVEVDIENIPLDDPKTFAMLARGETMGLFQLNGSGMTRFLKELKPSTIHDINAMVALYRPGPMESIPSYIERKHNPHKISFLDPRMKDILDRSFGVITYQDDVMMIAIQLAGYSWLEADKLRKAMGKKIPEVMEAEKEKLMEGLRKNGMEKRRADQLWKLIEPFAAYGFNKSHAASYGRVAYQTAYMKANFPIEYMSAVLTADSGDVEKVSEIITECTRMEIPVLPPDINESFEDFSVVPDMHGKTGIGEGKIRFGLTTIKNFGEGIAHAIIEERKAGGAFTSLEDFLSRINSQNFNKRSIEALAKAGALDSLGVKRNQVLAHIDILLAYNKERTKDTGQDSLFGSLREGYEPLTLPDAPALDIKEQLAWEKELLGLYISGHPLDEYRDKLDSRKKHIGEIKRDAPAGIEVVISGIITESKIIFTKKGDKMAFVRIADFNDSIEVVVFPKILAEYDTLFAIDNCVALKGKLTSREGERSVVVEKAKML